MNKVAYKAFMALHVFQCYVNYIYNNMGFNAKHFFAYVTVNNRSVFSAELVDATTFKFVLNISIIRIIRNSKLRVTINYKVVFPIELGRCVSLQYAFQFALNISIIRHDITKFRLCWSRSCITVQCRRDILSGITRCAAMAIKFSARSRITTINRSLESFLAATRVRFRAMINTRVHAQRREGRTQWDESGAPRSTVRTMLRCDATTARREAAHVLCISNRKWKR